MRRVAVVLGGFILGLAHTSMYAQTPVVNDAGCCGPITPAGTQLVEFLDGLHVDQLWPAHVHVNWKTGEPAPGHGGHEPPTHCSAFAAAAAMRLGIYILHPPDHPQEMLSLGQELWLSSRQGAEAGWRPVSSPHEAQELANQGEFVVLVYGREHGSGHIAIVRPSLKSEKALKKDGPETTQAGGHNFSDGNAVYSFIFHPGAWPNEVKIFAHATKFEQASEVEGAH